MIDRLRALAARPLAEGERTAAFVLAAAVLVGAAAYFLVAQPSGVAPTPSATPVLAPSKGAPASPATETESESTPVGPTALEVRRAKATGRRFLRGYLPYSYGRGSADEIRSATDELLAELAERPPHVPLTVEAARRAKVTAVQAEAAEDGEISVLAFVEDSERDYALSLALERVGTTWRVSRVAE